MANMSDYLETALLAWLVRNTDFAGAPNSIYLALHTAMPDEDASPTNEVPFTNSYARLITSCGTAGSGSGSAWTAPVDDGAGLMYTQNVAALTWPIATGSWGVITHVSMWDDPTAGNMLAWVALAASKSVGLDDIIEFAAGSLVMKAG